MENPLDADVDITEPLWIDVYKPSLEGVIQERVRNQFKRSTETKLNWLLYGPPGSGKTAAVKAFMEEVHDTPNTDAQYVNARSFFDISKDKLAKDQRWKHFINPTRKRNLSKAQLMVHVIKELAASKPISGEYKTIIIENGEHMREDFQHPLRRIMEQYHQSTQFIITTRTTGSIIDPIQSLMFPVPVRSHTDEEIKTRLREILETEDVSYTEEGLESLVSMTGLNIRRAITTAQTAAGQHSEVTTDSISAIVGSVGYDEDINAIFDDALDGNFGDARSGVDDLLIDEAIDGVTLLERMMEVAHQRFDQDEVVKIATKTGNVDIQIENGTSERIHIMNFLTEAHELTSSPP